MTVLVEMQVVPRWWWWRRMGDAVMAMKMDEVVAQEMEAVAVQVILWLWLTKKGVKSKYKPYNG